MPKFNVLVAELHYSFREVEAKDEEDAKRQIVDGETDGDEVFLEYSHTLDPEHWKVEEVK